MSTFIVHYQPTGGTNVSPSRAYTAIWESQSAEHAEMILQAVRDRFGTIFEKGDWPREKRLMLVRSDGLAFEVAERWLRWKRRMSTVLESLPAGSDDDHAFAHMRNHELTTGYKDVDLEVYDFCRRAQEHAMKVHPEVARITARTQEALLTACIRILNVHAMLEGEKCYCQTTCATALLAAVGEVLSAAPFPHLLPLFETYIREKETAATLNNLISEIDGVRTRLREHVEKSKFDVETITDEPVDFSEIEADEDWRVVRVRDGEAFAVVTSGTTKDHAASLAHEMYLRLGVARTGELPLLPGLLGDGATLKAWPESKIPKTLLEANNELDVKLFRFTDEGLSLRAALEKLAIEPVTARLIEYQFYQGMPPNLHNTFREHLRDWMGLDLPGAGAAEIAAAPSKRLGASPLTRSHVRKVKPLIELCMSWLHYASLAVTNNGAYSWVAHTTQQTMPGERQHAEEKLKWYEDLVVAKLSNITAAIPLLVATARTVGLDVSLTTGEISGVCKHLFCELPALAMNGISKADFDTKLGRWEAEANARLDRIRAQVIALADEVDVQEQLLDLDSSGPDATAPVSPNAGTSIRRETPQNEPTVEGREDPAGQDGGSTTASPSTQESTSDRVARIRTSAIVDQAMAHIRLHPGCTIAELADGLGKDRDHVRKRIWPRCRSLGCRTGEGGGCFPPAV